MTQRKFTRRNFMKIAAAGAVTSMSMPRVFAAESYDHHSILYNSLNCKACELCQQGCKIRNGLPPAFEFALTSSNYLYVSAGSAEEKEIKVRYSCMHCHDANCKSVCPVKAIKRSKQGFVHIDQSMCIGCGYCVVACPYSVPRFDHHNGVSSKCHGCYDLVEQGEKPGCVQTCPWDALDFGTRDEMVAKANNIMAENPGAQIYGLEEKGGLNVIYITVADPTKNGHFPVVSKGESLYPSSFIYGPILLNGVTLASIVIGYKLFFKGGDEE